MAMIDKIVSTIRNELKTKIELLLRPVTRCIVDLIQKEMKGSVSILICLIKVKHEEHNY